MEPLNELALSETERDASETLLREAVKLAAFIAACVRNAANAEDISQQVFL